jgi:hypothetical protein
MEEDDTGATHEKTATRAVTAAARVRALGYVA